VRERLSYLRQESDIVKVIFLDEEKSVYFYKMNKGDFMKMMKGVVIFFLCFLNLQGFGKDDLKKKLTPMQYKVTQEGATEPAFNNEYWNHKEPGIYVDVTTGDALFSSLDKYDSGTGWPSFTKGIEDDRFQISLDLSLGTQRQELKSKSGGAHLGHVFDDGPKEQGGKRFCINSAALRFVSLKDMEKEGYGKYLPLFQGAQSSRYEVAYLAGGCFWGMQDIIRKIPGVLKTEVGYSGGSDQEAKYNIVKLGKTKHAETVKVVFDPGKISYGELLNYFFRMHDPTTLNQQGNDIGTQYRSALFYTNAGQKQLAENKIKEIEKSGKWKKKITTEVTSFQSFYKAEEEHQDYLVKNPRGYTCHYLRD
jgi:peptide methionine sulfoxide reductase msrA/msrB